jgi:hypothetical protein
MNNNPARADLQSVRNKYLKYEEKENKRHGKHFRAS